MTDSNLAVVGETVEIFSKLWRDNLSVTLKAHIIEVRLMYFLRHFKGLRKHDEEFMECGHQDGIRNYQRSSNVRAYCERSMLHAIWDRLLVSPVVLDSFDKYDQNIRKLKAGYSRTLKSKEAKLERDETNMTRRENVKIYRTDS